MKKLFKDISISLFVLSLVFLCCGAFSPIAIKLSELWDVAMRMVPQNGNFLSYNAAMNRWTNENYRVVVLGGTNSTSSSTVTNGTNFYRVDLVGSTNNGVQQNGPATNLTVRGYLEDVVVSNFCNAGFTNTWYDLLSGREHYHDMTNNVLIGVTNFPASDSVRSVFVELYPSTTNRWLHFPGTNQGWWPLSTNGVSPVLLASNKVHGLAIRVRYTNVIYGLAVSTVGGP
jgi:hypothetical protein